MTNARPFVRPKEAPEFFGISKATLYRWANKGAFEIIKIGHVAYVRRADVERYMNQGA